MASDNQLRARVPESHVEQIRQVSKDRDIAETEAERVVVREGLTSLGRIERPAETSKLVVYYAKQIGMILGFVGLILVGLGIFGSNLFSYIGFGLLLAGFGSIAGSEFGPRLMGDGDTA